MFKLYWNNSSNVIRSHGWSNHKNTPKCSVPCYFRIRNNSLKGRTMFSLHLPCDARRLVTYNSTVSDPRMPNEINILWPTLLPNTAKFKILYLHHYKDRIFLGQMTTLNTKMTTVKISNIWPKKKRPNSSLFSTPWIQHSFWPTSGNRREVCTAGIGSPNPKTVCFKLPWMP